MTPPALAEALGLRRVGRGWRGVCPVHGGTSFTLDERDGRAVWKCWSGCSQAEVLSELRRRGLWPERERVEWTAEQKRQYARARADAEAFARLAAAWLSERLDELEAMKAAAVDLDRDRWDVDALGTVAAEHFHLSSLDAPGALRAWRKARQDDPHGARQLERIGLTWRRVCEGVVQAVVASHSKGVAADAA